MSVQDRRRPTRPLVLAALSAVMVLAVGSSFVTQRLTGSDSAGAPVVRPALPVTPTAVVTPSMPNVAVAATPTPAAVEAPTAAGAIEPTPTAAAAATPTAAPTPMATATPEPAATPEPTATVTPTREPTPTATAPPEPTATAPSEPMPEPTPTAKPEPTPMATPSAADRSWAPPGSLDGATDQEVQLLRRLYEDRLWEWDELLGHWYPLSYTDADGEVHVWTPPFPGAPRLLTDIEFFFASAAESVYSHWVAEIGLELPPALVRYTRTNPFRPGAAYEDDQIGFHPPLRPGVNVVWAAGVDMTDLSLRPECPVISRLEVLTTGWVWPTAEIARSESTLTYEEYLAQMNGGYPPSSRPGERQPIHTGSALVWSEQHQAAFFRATESTPYGWYTFDIETMRMRPVDTEPDSWDTINLWEFEVPHSVGIGVSYYNQIYGATLPPGIEPWPPFDPWREVVPRYADATAPGPLRRSDNYFEPTPPNRWGFSEYMRITCE